MSRRRYRDVSREAGILPESGHGLSATWFDYDGDARPDLYVVQRLRRPGLFLPQRRQMAPDGIVAIQKCRSPTSCR